MTGPLKKKLIKYQTSGGVTGCLGIIIISKTSIGLSPLPVTVTTRIITYLVGDPYKPSFATVTGKGDYPRHACFGHLGRMKPYYPQHDLELVNS